MNTNELITKRKKIRREIHRYYKNHKNAIKLADEYQRLTKEISAQGINVSAKLDFLYPEFWKNYPKCFENHEYVQYRNKAQEKKLKLSQNSKSSKTINKNSENETKKNYYILNAACSFCGDRPWDFDVLTNYISSLELKLVKDDYNEYVNKEEIVMGYEFFGTEDEFNILKKCVQKVCDMVKNDTDMDVYGCKRNF